MLTIEDEGFLGTHYGLFLAIWDKRKPHWPGIKYDLIPKEPYYGESFYQFVETLIKLSQDCEIGLSCKDKIIYPNSLSINRMHLYLHIEENLPNEELRRRLMNFFRLAKHYFGDTFRLNITLSSKNKAMTIFSEEERKELELNEKF